MSFQKREEYQQEAVSLLVEKSLKMIEIKEENPDFTSILLFDSVTGSGKTVMMAKYIKEMTDKLQNIAFVWFSIGKGGVHLQSAKSLSKFLTNKNVLLGDDVITQRELLANDTLVINWESINNIDNETKEFTNLLMRDGEMINLREIWSDTISSGVKIIAIIDESHMNNETEHSELILKCLNPVLTIEVTATHKEDRLIGVVEQNKDYYLKNEPLLDDYAQMSRHQVKVSRQAVVEAEMIKKDVYLNQDLVDFEKDDSEISWLIKSALKKRDELEGVYRAEGSIVNPLCLIQLPDNDNVLKASVLEILKNSGYDIENGNLAIHLSEEKEGLEGIKEFQSPIKVLLFKQAVATGWDCPRASILVELRKGNSKTLKLQVLGRILRMPECKFYNHDELNNGYVYTQKEFSLEHERSSDGTRLIYGQQHLKSEFESDVQQLKFPSEYLKTNDILKINNYTSKAEFEMEFYKKLTDALSNVEFETDDLIFRRVIESATFDVGKESVIQFGEQEYCLNDVGIDLEYKQIVKKITRAPFATNDTDRILRHYFNDKGFKTPSDIKKIVVKYKGVLEDKIIETMRHFETREKTEVKEFVFPIARDVAAKTKGATRKKSAYENQKESDYKTEAFFEKELDKSRKVDWWIKNVDKGDGLCMLYEYDGKLYEFYPDYVVKYHDGTIGIYEVKDAKDRDGQTITPIKAKVLDEYIEELNLNSNAQNYAGQIVHVSNGNAFTDFII